MLIDTLNERIIDMKTVHEMETASADTKKQAMADYNFKQLILNLKQMVDEVNLAVENSDFRPSANVISALKSFLGVCEKVVQTGVANNATTQYISFESKKLYTVIGQEWSEFYLKATANILSLLDTVKGIIPDENKAIYATNKIKKASSWNVTIDNYNYLKQGIAEADKILEDLDLDEDSEILAFLKLVSEGKATILNLTDEILAWIKAENLADKMFINFYWVVAAMDEVFKYDCNLNIGSFIHMLDDPTECYKFYWLDSIMQLLAEKEESITFDKVISGMIADAWYSVTEYHLKMGTRDTRGNSVNSIERAVNKLNEMNCFEYTVDRRQILEKIKENEKLLHDEKYQIAKNVPYRLLSAFMRELGGNDPLWSQRTRLIAYMEKISNRCCMPYIIGTERGLEKRIILEGSWKRFLIDNMVYIRGWIQMKKIKYLQDRNPGVPGIIYKLEPENEKHRKLQKIRGLWTAVIEMSDIYDIYSGSHIEQNEYEIDHFVPWSFVTNDEMWNLIPVNPSLNASKRDKLPNWDRYFLSFAQNQFRLNQMVYKYERLAHIFRECQRDSLNAAWSVEELYVKNIKNDQFCKVLESRLKPIYELARTQGYRIWMVGE